NDIAAAIGVANLPDAIEAVHKHFANAERLQAALHDLESHGVRVPPLAMGSAYWIFTILVDDRPSFVEHMTERGIQVSQVHRRNDVHPAFNREHDIGLHGLEEFSARQVSIPCGWWLEPTHLDRIIDGVRTWAHGHRQ
ncbi:MAG TPA: DegT/DnrJ/EryC1/StrS family aminotransferase, partial [Kofleriaceae bacterium]|nr:DegT/DnrJ/EryC1/StrS family aminotransferase [Kofleriaceae bacterium]